MWEALSSDKRLFLRAWVLGLIASFVALTTVGTWIIETEKREAKVRQAARMTTEPIDDGVTQPEALPADGDFTVVSVGLYLEDVDHLSIKESYWSGTFRLWFRWKGSRDIDPANNFVLLDADIEKKDIVTESFGADGVNYQAVRLDGRMTKFFDTTRVPLDNHLLTIAVEDSARDASKVRYVADQGTALSSRAKVVGYAVGEAQAVVKPHTYKSDHGDPRVSKTAKRTFTTFVVGVPIKRESMGLYFKLLIGLFAGIGLTMCSFFIRPCDTSPRFSLPTASYFGAVSNSYLVNSTLPSTGQFGLTDIVTSMGLFTIFMCVMASLISCHYYLTKKDHEFASALDRATRDTVGIAYLIANIIFPITAFTDI